MAIVDLSPVEQFARALSTPPAAYVSTQLKDRRTAVPGERALAELARMQAEGVAWRRKIERSFDFVMETFADAVPNLRAEVMKGLAQIISEAIGARERNLQLNEEGFQEARKDHPEIPLGTLQRLRNGANRIIAADRKLMVDLYYRVLSIEADADPEAKAAGEPLRTHEDLEAYFQRVRAG